MNRKYFLLGLFLLVLYGMWYLYRPFLLPVFIASLLALATNSINLFVKRYIRYNIFSATIMTLGLALLFFAPIVYALNGVAHIVNDFDPAVIDKIVGLKNSLHLPDYLGFVKPHIKEFLDSLDPQAITKNIIGFASVVIKKSAGFFKDMVLILVFYFFVNLYSKELSKFLKSILPFDENSPFFQEISGVMSVVFYSTILNAVLQGALFAIIVMFFGYDGLLFGILYGFASLVPVVGGTIMWLPISLYEYASGHTSAAIIIALYTVIVISTIADNFVKPVIIKYVREKLTDNKTVINEIVIFFSIIAGLTTYGFWGMVLGPAITTFFISLAKIYQVLLDEEKHNAI
jgi:predicted PurR-regulated permease PerM